MSAWVVSKKHIDYLVSAAVLYGRQGSVYWGIQRADHSNADTIGRDLTRENIASVAYRYSEPEDSANLPGPVPLPIWDEYTHRMTVNIEPVVLLKAIDCYEYQSCEHPDWGESAAKKFCGSLRGAAIAHLPGYDAAPWGID